MISPPTTGHVYQIERYAFLWKRDKVTKIGHGWLEKKYQSVIEREPYFAKFRADGKDFTLVCFHAIPKARQPETEIKYFKYLPSEYPSLCLIFMGDFNCPQQHTVFKPLKTLGYRPVLNHQKTSLRQKCINGDCLASEYDNIFYPADRIKYIYAGVIHFYQVFTNMKAAREISDHIPVVFEFTIK
jgi:endonuclease/exonuclease/phosphatase family metal-dependent hydrolase